MRLRRRNRPAPFLNRRDQIRMLGFVALLALVMIGIETTRHPHNWVWFFAMDDGHSSAGDGLRDLDFQVIQRPRDELAQDEFLAVSDAVPVQLADMTISDPAALRQFNHPALGRIEDQRVGFLRSEQPVFDALLDHVRRADEVALRTAGDTSVGFRVLNADPQSYRGRLMTLTGTLRQYTPWEQGSAERGGPPLFQGWLFTPDSGNNPWFVLCTEPTPELEFAERLEKQVQVTGYFFKRFGYPTNTSLHVAPLLIARRFEVLPSPSRSPLPIEGATKYFSGFFAGIAGLFGLLVLWLAKERRRFASSRLVRIAAARHETQLDHLQTLKTVDLPMPGELRLPEVNDGAATNPPDGTME